MRTLVYVDGPEVSDALKQWASKRDGQVHWRNGRLFEAPERRVDQVVTDLAEVRDAYDSHDAEVIDMPGHKNEASRRRYVPEEGDAGWVKVKDRKTGEYVDGASKRSMEAAKQAADKLNNG